MMKLTTKIGSLFLGVLLALSLGMSAGVYAHNADEKTLAKNKAPVEKISLLMQTNLGAIYLDLYPKKAPVTVNNFLQYVDGKYYNGGSFYRVVGESNQAQNKIKIGVIQGGMGMDENPRPFAPIAHETTEATGLLHEDGVISIARGEPGTAQSEFFICVDDQPALDFGGMRNPDGKGFAAFGRVTKGMDVVRAIQKQRTDTPDLGKLEYTSGQILLEPVSIVSISRVKP